MKLLAVNGSHRGKEGVTYHCIEKIFQGASKKGAKCEVINLMEYKINQCIGCNLCHSKESYLKCIYSGKDDVDILFNKIKEADIIIYGTPVYIFSMTSILRRFMERFNSTGDSSKITISKDGLFFHHIDKSICSKPFVVLVTCDNIENQTVKNTLEYFKTFSKFMDAPHLGTIVRKSAALITNCNGNKRVEEIYSGLQGVGEELAEYGRISNVTKRKASLSVVAIPLFIKLAFHIKTLKIIMFPKIKIEMDRAIKRNEELIR